MDRFGQNRSVPPAENRDGTAVPAPHGWAAEVEDLVRAASGGMLVGVPLLYTTEVWGLGSRTTPLRMCAVLVLTFVSVLVLNRTSGFRSSKDVNLAEAAMDTVDALAIGIVCVTVMLIVFQEITWETSTAQALGKIVYQVAPFGLGVGLASHFLRDDGGEAPFDPDDGVELAGRSRLDPTVADVGATVTGAVFVALAIAPTDEVRMLASAMNARWMLALVGVSLVVSYAIVFEAGFTNEQRRHQQKGLFQAPLPETVVSYLLALASAAVMLWFFQRVGRGEPWQVTLDRTVVLALPAAVGGAAGRLAV